MPRLETFKFTPLVLFLFFLIFPAIWPFFLQASVFGASTEVRVGIYRNEPGVFTNKEGVVQGFYIDILENTAAEEEWPIKYIAGSWAQGLARLKKGEIDLLVAIAYTRQRAQQFDFNQETTFSNWGQVYVRDSKLDSILLLQGKTIAGLENDIYANRFKTLLLQFNLEHTFLDLPDYDAVLKSVASGKADAGIISRSNGLITDKNHSVFKSAIICCPMEIRYATPKNKGGKLLQALDRNLKKLKSDKDSFYYQSFNRWFVGDSGRSIPRWLVWVVIGAAGLLILLFAGNIFLRRQVQARTMALEKEITTRKKAVSALRDSMQNLLTIQIAPGVFWLKIPEAGLYILCGCPGEVVKHLMRKGFINTASKGKVTFETGPNVILLSDLLIQNGGFSNLAEFPVLQMLYRQGMILPGHPNNTGIKPILIGSPAQVRAQMEYIHRGNYGLVSKAEIMACGVDEALAETLMRIKLKFAFGAIRPPSQILDTLEVEADPVKVRNGVTVLRTGFNRYQFSYRGRSTEVNLNLPAGIPYESPYPLGHHRFRQHPFAVLHTGEGDGWDVDRPSMGSVVMFQGHIYLIDASPGVLHGLTSLGIDVGEVDGVFHTHGHDDHFAGLPALIRTDRRLKYFATPLVRASVTKKFAALMSLKEEAFSRFFQIQDLDFDTWNDCDGLEVMPLYSPHPLETNILLFRARDGDQYKSYAHWADLSSHKVLDGMTGTGDGAVDPAFMAKVKAHYALPASLKKLDIGGGLIHGVAEDFRHDRSDRLILAHIDRKLTTEEMEIGSETSFGAVDVLIPGHVDFLHRRAFAYLHDFFPDVPPEEIHALLDSPMVEHNAGTIIRQFGTDDGYADMVLSGTVAYLEAAANVRNHLSFGSFVGGGPLFDEKSGYEGTYRAVSHCTLIRFTIPRLRDFLERNGLLADMKAIVDTIWFLRKTWLFGEQTTFLSLGRVARAMLPVACAAGSDVPMTTGPALWLVITGEIELQDAAGQGRETIKAGGFFGEHTYLGQEGITGKIENAPGQGHEAIKAGGFFDEQTHIGHEDATNWKYHANQAAELYQLQLEKLLEIPIVHWKMLEVFEKRQRLLSAANNSNPAVVNLPKPGPPQGQPGDRRWTEVERRSPLPASPGKNRSGQDRRS